MTRHKKRIAIIGAGASGLAAIKCCLDEDLEPVCFESRNEIGGLWNYTDEAKPDQGGTYKSCVINTSKEMMCFSDFPIPQHFPPFMPHAKVLEYLELYAEKFTLKQFIKFGVKVRKLEKSDDFDDTGNWSLILEENECVSSEVFSGVMVCTGHHVYPHVPLFPRFDNFHGLKIHSKEYKVPDHLVDKAVLIVGIGNSAADIAVDVSRVTKKVYLSTRHGAWIVSRMGPLGYPADAIANSRFAFSLPFSWLQWLVEVMANYRFNHENYGVKAMHRALEAHPTINDELPYKIMVGAVEARPDISHFSSTKVHFVDGSSETIDAVIMATGYMYKYPFIDDSVLKVEKNKVDLYKYVFPPHLKHNTLGIIGLVQAIGAVIPIAEMQARWYTRVISGKCVLPQRGTMMIDIERKKMAMNEQYIPSQRHTLQTFWIDYMDEIANEVGAKPNLLNLCLKDPWLGMRCIFGPCTPAQYRLNGPGKWKGAKQVINTALVNNVVATKTRVIGKKTDSVEFSEWGLIHVVFVVFVMLFLYYAGLLF